MPYQKVTMIEDLPDLNQIDIESQSSQPRGEQEQERKLNRFIRHGHNGNFPPESGMQMYPQEQGDNNGFGIPTSMEPQYRPKISHEIMEPYDNQQSLHCGDMYNHVKGCHICQRFYKTDNTVYFIIIAILIIACALLAKKVLNV